MKAGSEAADALALVRRFIMQCHPDAEAAWLSGSRSRGEGTASSDYDVIMLFAEVPDGAWRETGRFEGNVIEAFAHDIGTLRYFCRNIDRPSGLPVLPTMVAEGIVAFSRSSALIEEAKQIAAVTLASGPPPLAAETIQERRYAITELAATLADGRGDAVMISVGAALHIALADFSLRAAGRWSARGKAIPRALAAMDPALDAKFATAFTALFALKDTGPVQSLVDTVLAPYSGRFRTGYRHVASAAWRI
jgi:hypothetical protein